MTEETNNRQEENIDILKVITPLITIGGRVAGTVSAGIEQPILSGYLLGTALWDLGEFGFNLYKLNNHKEIKGYNFFEKRLIENVLYKPLKYIMEETGIIKSKKNISSKL